MSGEPPFFEVGTSPLTRSNDGRLLIDIHRPDGVYVGWAVYDTYCDNDIALLTGERVIADAYVAGYDRDLGTPAGPPYESTPAGMTEAHAEGLHSDLPREGCPECARR